MISDFLIRISADGKSFFPVVDQMNRETRRLTAAVSGFKNVYMAIGSAASALGIKTAVDYIGQLIDRVDQLKNRSQTLGIDTTSQQKIDNLFGDKGTTAIVRMAEAQEKIFKGGKEGKEMAENMAKFGISLEDIRTKNR